METGWAKPDVAPEMPLTQLLLRRGERQPGSVLAGAMARSRAAEAREAREAASLAPDPDEHAAALISRGYRPGQIPALSLQLADTEAELEGERDKIAKGAQRAGYVHRDLAAGRLSPLEAARRMDLVDEGDPAVVEKLERKAASIRRQIAEMAEAVTPRESRERDAVEQAAGRSRRILADVARMRQEEDAARAQAAARVAEDRTRFYSSRGRLPFTSRGADVAAEPVCAGCAAAGATAEESALIHPDPEFPPVPEAQAGTLDGETGRATWAPGVSFR